MKKFLTITQAMSASRLPRQALYVLVRKGKLRSRRLGWQIFVDQRSLAVYCRERSRAIMNEGCGGGSSSTASRYRKLSAALPARAAAPLVNLDSRIPSRTWLTFDGKRW
jgi:hypothetical protein